MSADEAQPSTCTFTPMGVPKQPWERLHADFAGPFLGRMFLIVIDAFSKWLEVKPLSAATSGVTIEHLHSIFATHGLPKIFVTDNGTPFTSAEFQSFTENNGIIKKDGSVRLCGDYKINVN